jgi:coenzyme F420 hydrogenase subunit beta
VEAGAGVGDDRAALAGCRGMRMGYAPMLALLKPARARGFRRLAIIGIPCQVYALRALEAELGFERLYVIAPPAPTTPRPTTSMSSSIF